MHSLKLLALRSPGLLTAAAFLLAGFLSAFVVHELETERARVERANANALVHSHAALIHTTLNQSLSANYALAAMLEHHHGEVIDFDSTAVSLLEYYPALSHLALSPDGVITHVYPLQGNESTLGFNQLEDDEQGTEASLARISGTMTLAGPLELVQGGVGLIARLPVYLEKHDEEPLFWGFTNVALRLPDLLSEAGLSQLLLSGYEYKLLRPAPHGNTQDIIDQSDKQVLTEPVTATIQVPNGYWELHAEPVGGWGNKWHLTRNLLLGLLFPLLIILQTHLLLRIYRHRHSLEGIVHKRTADILEAQSQLKATLDAIPDLLFEVDLSGRILAYHSPRTELLNLPPEAFMNRQFAELLPVEASTACMEAIQEAHDNNFSSGKSYPLQINGNTHWFELSVARKKMSNGNARFIMLARDITERKETEVELRIAATAFNSLEGILVTDADQTIIRVNQAFTRITGYEAHEVIGKKPSILSSGRHDRAFYDQMYTQLNSEGGWQGEVWNRRKSGEVYPEWLSIAAIHDHQGRISHYLATLTDMTERKEREDKINRLAFYDPLTQLPNRRLLGDRLDHALANSQRGQYISALILVDLDNFKYLNDSLGLKTGDQLLQQTASRLKRVVRENDTLARLGGDEFIALVEGIGTDSAQAAARAEQIAEKIATALNEPYQLKDQLYYSTASIGVTLFENHHATGDELLKQVDQAMYQAKAAGRNQICFFDPDLQHEILERIALINALREAINKHQLQLYYQPQTDAQSKVIGTEALIRWKHPERGMVSPGLFIPLAEETGQILAIGEWVLKTACQQLAQWHQTEQGCNLIMSVNVSARQFNQPDFVMQVHEVLTQTGASPRHLQIELTESSLVANTEEVISKMQQLKASGILISLDDFGTGYSSLAYLRQLPIDQLKIDQSFVNNITTGDHDATLATAIISLGHSLGLEVIAEGVETQEQFTFLRQQGCDLFQGYLLGKPAPADTIFQAEVL
ncbi:EAL domain-containing protein [Nitrincola alkalilacustris]|uniref:EAL domain-containing protein n=1 Tax=Nitrincola alkalilacustris TaxID=1571224 RepID=UPI0014575FC4|nr:EAL domain-containing protein [Nitrincola alkalilacustris]